MEDSEIIELFYERSEQAIEEVSRKYGNLCRSIAMNVLNNRQDAEESANSAYLGVWNTIPPQRPKSLSAYLSKIVRNISIDRYYAKTAKKRGSKYDVAFSELENCLSSVDSVEGEYSANELRESLNCFLASLDKENRVLFVRRYWYSDSMSEIADRLGITENSARVKCSRLLKRLRKFLAEKEGFAL